MTNFEFFSRLLLVFLVICLYSFIVYIMASYNDHIETYGDICEHREIKLKYILSLYKNNKDRFLFIDLDPGFFYELLVRPEPKLNIHLYRTSIEVTEGTTLYYYTLGIFDFIVYQVYYFVIFRFTTKKPNITIENLKGKKGIAR